ncbi:AraC family transcriptional regulator [Danxiaibacter flavus]|uniref:AraC family transcriptional regulator n=1 Tax=Danxiaibacter flavus TaxID=3049108 RepID=A0ABV3ZAE7_9BACT|nr:AraC family transcriptional regulator [Chitinophagaceae bacterium DXS]
MDFFKLEQHQSELLRPFPEIFEFGYEKYSTIRLGSLERHLNPGIEICFIKKGRYNWVIENEQYLLYPKNASVTMPWEYHGSKEGFLDIGTLFWVIITPRSFTPDGKLQLSNSFSQDQHLTEAIGKVFVSRKQPVLQNGSALGKIFEEMAIEITQQPLGFKTRVYYLLYDLMLTMARNLLEEMPMKKHTATDLQKLNSVLHETLDHDWSVEEMAAVVGKKVTSFTSFLKNKTGLTPINYLIELRIQEAKKLLLDEKNKISDVAWECGFSSTQHFSNTFRQKTGVSPSTFIKDNHKV